MSSPPALGATGFAVSGRRFLVAAFGDAGHAFPAIALARALRGRGHEVVVETWERWRDAVEGEGLAFTAAEEYTTFPPSRGDSGTWRSAADAAIALLPLMEDFRPDVVVSDILTLAPTLAAERVGVNRATLIPHVYPVHEPGLPFFAFGMQPPRTPVGRAVWRGAQPVLESGLRRGRDEMNETRAAVGLPTVESFHGGISRELAMVATFPQLEYPRRWPAGVNVTGPMQFELHWRLGTGGARGWRWSHGSRPPARGRAPATRVCRSGRSARAGRVARRTAR